MRVKRRLPKDVHELDLKLLYFYLLETELCSRWKLKLQRSGKVIFVLLLYSFLLPMSYLLKAKLGLDVMVLQTTGADYQVLTTDYCLFVNC